MSSRKDEIAKRLHGFSDSTLEKIEGYMESLTKEDNREVDFKFSAPSEQIKLGEDVLKRSDAARTLANIIRTDIIPPFTIGVFGKWGSGKTIFLDLLKQALTEDDCIDFEIITFNAWKYESTGNVVYSLFKHIERHLPNDLRKKKQSLHVGKAFMRVGTKFLDKKLGIDIKDKGLLQNIGRLGVQLEKILDESYENVSSLAENFSSYIQDILHHKKKKAVVVIIDDLDRCEPENVVKILESIKNFLSTPGCIFVLAADREAVTSGIRGKYGESVHISGDEYLDKIVNLSFEIELDPRAGVKDLVESYKNQFQSILGGLKLDFIVDAFEITGNQNARTARRILDKFALFVKTIRMKKVNTIDIETLLFALIIQELTPEFVRDLKRISRFGIIDKISDLSPPGTTINIEKLSEDEQMAYKYYFQPGVRDLINGFKSFHFKTAKPQRERIAAELKKCMKYVDNLTC